MSKKEADKEQGWGVRYIILLFFSCFLHRVSLKLKSFCQWQTRKLRLRTNPRQKWLLTLCSSLQVSTRGFGLVLLCSHPSSYLQHSAECTAEDYQYKYSKHPCLKYMTSPHSTEKGSRTEIRLQVFLFQSMTRPFALSLFPNSNGNSLFRRSRGRKKRHVTGEFGVVTERNSLNFSIYH